jgi:hypothetical protein
MSADDEWSPEDLEIEAAMLRVKPGKFLELHGAVVFCSAEGVRGVMDARDWKRMRGEDTE